MEMTRNLAVGTVLMFNAVLTLPLSAQPPSRTSGLTDRLGSRPRLETPQSRPRIADMIRSVRISPDERLRLKPKYPIFKGKPLVDEANAEPGRIVFKFVDGSRVRAFNPKDLNVQPSDAAILRERLSSLSSAQRRLDKADLAFLAEHGIKKSDIEGQMNQVRSILSQVNMVDWQPVFSKDLAFLDGLRANTEKHTGRRASDLANYYSLGLAKGVDAQPVLDALNALPIIEQAYLRPRTFEPDIPPATGDYSGMQDYLNDDGNGLHARVAWSEPGAKGDFVGLIDIENGWNINHEDLPSFFTVPDHMDSDDDHGTAVMGMLVGLHDGAGVDGIVPNASAGLVSNDRGLLGTRNNAGAVLEAAIRLSVGDVILLEAQTGGPGGNDCTCETDDGSPADQCGLVPVEWADDAYDAIVAASNSGLLVVEAAGNGQADLDDARYNGRFDRAQRDSGALIVASSATNARERRCSSNAGSRVDLHGWGSGIMTAGYGRADGGCDPGQAGCLDAQEARVGGDRNQWYTPSFSGTSGASPMVTGAAVALQGVMLARGYYPLNWDEMRQVLVVVGTQPVPDHLIGPLPNIAASIALLPAAPSAPDENTDPGTDVIQPEYETSPILGDDVVLASATAGLATNDSNQRIVIGGGERYQAIERIMFAERGDRPCYIRVEKAHIVDNVRGNRREVDECGSSGHTSQSVRYVPLLTTSHDTFIRKVAVCNSRTNRRPSRLKGIKVWRTRIEPDGRIFPLAGEIEERRTNCDGNWRTPSECPTGHVATRVEVHLRGDGNDLSVSGLRLMCRPVELEQTCVANCP